MKQLFVFTMMLLSVSFVYAQDVITLRTGETINAKVSEVGINEVKYLKSSNVNGPVYVAVKADISQILYENGTKDVFNSTSQTPTTVIVQQPAPQTVYVQQPVYRRNFWNSGWGHPFIVSHIDIGHHGGYYYGGHHRGHGGHH